MTAQYPPPTAPVPPHDAQPPAQHRNGFGVTSLVTGIVGLALSWIPFVGFVGFVLGIIAIVFGAVAVYRNHKHTANNMTLSYFGLALGVVAFVISLVTWGHLANSLSTPKYSSPSQYGGVPAGPPPALVPGQIPGDGIFLVGKDVQPGTYKSSGATGSGCYYARMHDASDSFGSVISNNFQQRGPSVVTINPSDGAFKTSGCETWQLAR